MRTSLAAVVNNSTMFSSVNRLPPEVLSRIFEASKTHCICGDGYCMDDLAGICVYWRKIALNTASLWTHVDIEPKTSPKLIELLLGRSKNLLIHAHILEIEPERDSRPLRGLEVKYATANMMMALQLHLHRISALSIDSNNDSGHFIRGVLDIWSDWGTNSSLRSLAVDWCPPWSDTVLKLPRKSRASHSTEHVLRNLDTLHLRYVMFKWESSIYNGLIDLQLDFEGDPVWIPFPKLANILITCPALATLKLSHLHILEEWNQMQRLEYVNLVHMEPEDAGLVLSVITLPGPRVELGITYSRKGTPDNRLAGFFARSKVTTLYYTCCDWCESCSNDRCCKSKSFKASEFFPRYLPHVQTLILRNFDLSVTNVDQTSALPPPTPLQSQLQGLILLKCTVDSEALNRLVLEIGVQELHLEQCKTDNLLEGDQRQQELQTMQASLRKIYPQLRCRISSIDSTENLSCRTIFD